jgi:hypothetical protein
MMSNVRGDQVKMSNIKASYGGLKGVVPELMGALEGKTSSSLIEG